MPGKPLSGVEQVITNIRRVTDITIDAVSGFGLSAGEKKLRELSANSRKNIRISAILNGVMLLCAALTAVFMLELKGLGLLIIAFINYITLGRTFFNITRFVRAVFIPYRPLIAVLLPVFLRSLRKIKSFKAAIQDTIRAAVRFIYNGRVPEIARGIHGFTSDFGLIKNLAEIEDKAARDFYPLVCRFLRVVLVYNVLLFTVCYGLLVFMVKHFVIGTMLDMTFIGLYAYPLVYITGILGE